MGLARYTLTLEEQLTFNMYFIAMKSSLWRDLIEVWDAQELISSYL